MREKGGWELGKEVFRAEPRGCRKEESNSRLDSRKGWPEGERKNRGHEGSRHIQPGEKTRGLVCQQTKQVAAFVSVHGGSASMVVVVVEMREGMVVDEMGPKRSWLRSSSVIGLGVNVPDAVAEDEREEVAEEDRDEAGLVLDSFCLPFIALTSLL